MQPPHQPPVTPSGQPPLLRKLDGRLQHLYQWATGINHYDNIWDLCCDHGRLGLHLHQSPIHSHSHIHLIDQVPAIIERLQKQCANHPSNRLSIECLNASEIKLQTGRHLIILAGIGGKNATEIISTLLKNNLSNTLTTIEIDLLLSPTNHTYCLRRFLNTSRLKPVKEEFISEKGHDYEHLFYRLDNRHNDAHKAQNHNPAGSLIWQPMTPQKKRYLQKLIKYHQACQYQDPTPATIKALTDYQSAIT